MRSVVEAVVGVVGGGVVVGGALATIRQHHVHFNHLISNCVLIRRPI